MGWLFLSIAIVTEVGATLSLRMAVSGTAVSGRRTWYAAVVTGYVIAFGMLALALDAGLPLGVAYGIWAAVGVALTALAGRVLFGEPFTWLMGLGIALIVGGVLLVDLGAVY